MTLSIVRDSASTQPELFTELKSINLTKLIHESKLIDNIEKIVSSKQAEQENSLNGMEQLSNGLLVFLG